MSCSRSVAVAPSRLRWHLHPRARSSVRPKISSRGDVFRVPLLHGALMKDRYPTVGEAILVIVLHTELIGRVAQD
jgi:hypothetical protein